MTPSPCTVLVVEDDAAMRPLLRRVLSRCPCHVLEAASGPEGLATSEQLVGPLHLLLVDVNRPDMSGRELAARVRTRWPNVRVLVLSDDSCFGSEPVLSKPFRAPELIAKVLELLRESSS